jgi:OOP family OmpA-OmpF porin
MAIDLMDLVKGYLTPDVIQRAAGNIGESNSATQKALAGIVPTLVAGLANTASTDDGTQQLTRMLDAGKYDGSALGSVASLFSGGAPIQNTLNTGKGILDSLFGGKVGSISDVIARFAGIRADSAASLLAMVAPLVLHALGKARASVGPGPAALTSLLGEQKSFLSGLLPAGLGSILGGSGLAAAASGLGASAAATASRVTHDVATTLPPTGRPSRLSPILIAGAILLAVVAWLVWPSSDVHQAARKLSELQLPGGVRISVPEGSFNYSVASWLANTTDITVPKRFVFEDLNFETGSTALTPESVDTVSSLVAVLKAYPAVSVTLEGHTDNTGDPAANKKLSFDRATAVKDLMVKGGVAESRITSAGLGQENPVAPNDTEEGRAKNRRLEMVVVKR